MGSGTLSKMRGVEVLPEAHFGVKALNFDVDVRKNCLEVVMTRP